MEGWGTSSPTTGRGEARELHHHTRGPVKGELQKREGREKSRDGRGRKQVEDAELHS